ncbi:hypothetical protein VTL71DRAFT_16264 [Oculimacula yallundae]|uniref:Uncharacterized protein n=1 Tax=Oculimacula yallundae TaxID=86028 RepID=A0ABR4CFA3_9HELO
MFTVAVTGNAPFMEFDWNTSLLVRDALPEFIQRPGKEDIRILKFARVTRDMYEDVRRTSAEIWGGRRALFLPEPAASEKEDIVDVSMVLHLGMVALGWNPNVFRFETIARREGYKLPGDDGKHIDSKELKDLGLPETLHTSFDIEAAWRKVKDQYPLKILYQDPDTSVSDDAGLYFCEFRLYSSLAEPLLNEKLRNKSGRVVFQHLPQAHSSEAIELARDVTVAFISALADDSIAVAQALSL